MNMETPYQNMWNVTKTILRENLQHKKFTIEMIKSLKSITSAFILRNEKQKSKYNLK